MQNGPKSKSNYLHSVGPSDVRTYTCIWDRDDKKCCHRLRVCVLGREMRLSTTQSHSDFIFCTFQVQQSMSYKLVFDSAWRLHEILLMMQKTKKMLREKKEYNNKDTIKETTKLCGFSEPTSCLPNKYYYAFSVLVRSTMAKPDMS